MKWLKEAKVFDAQYNIQDTFDALIHHQSIIQALNAHDLNNPFPVQKAVLQNIWREGDLYVCAPTGSGKTLAYTLPIMCSLLSRKIVKVRALIVVPSRDLCKQVKATLDTLLSALPTATSAAKLTALALGWQGVQWEAKNLKNVDIIVSTPGRLLEHLEAGDGRIVLEHLQWLVFDEADRLMQDDYLLDIVNAIKGVQGDESIHSFSHRASWLRSSGDEMCTPPFWWCTRLKMMLFSATLGENAAMLTSLPLHRPLYIRVTDGDGDGSMRWSKPPNLTEYIHVCEEERKPLALSFILRERTRGEKTICFVGSIADAMALTRLLARLVPELQIVPFTGKLDNAQRTAAIAAFQEGKVDLLVCTDVAARGLDLVIENVINYNVPVSVESFVHRVGRTARAGRSGRCWSICAVREAHHFKALCAQFDSHAIADVDGSKGDARMKTVKIPKTWLQEHLPVYTQILAEKNKTH